MANLAESVWTAAREVPADANAPRAVAHPLDKVAA
jgi:hypothetical protein